MGEEDYMTELNYLLGNSTRKTGLGMSGQGFMPALVNAPQSYTGTAAVVGAGVSPDRGIFSSFLPQKYADGSTGGGWGSVGLSAGQALMNGFLGLRQYGLMKDSLKEQKRQFNINFDAQKKMINSQLEDRQRARVASNPGAHESVEDYLDKNRIG